MNKKILALISFILFITLISYSFGYTTSGSAFYCTNCTDCVNALENNTYNTTYLNKSIDNQVGSCIDTVNTWMDKTFDCQGAYYIDGDSHEDLSDYGVHVNGTNQGAKVKNCEVLEFGEGIRVSDTGTHGALIINNSCHHNTYGIYLIYSTDGNITLNNATDNYHSGLFFYAQNNTATNNTANSNTITGLTVYSAWSTGNTIYENELCDNWVYDINDTDNTIGDDNTCNNTFNYNDTGTTGCTNLCTEEPPTPDAFNCTYSMQYPAGQIRFNGNQTQCNQTWNCSYNYGVSSEYIDSGIARTLVNFIPILMVVAILVLLVGYIQRGGVIDVKIMVVIILTLVLLTVVFQIITGQTSTAATVDTINNPVVDIWNSLTYNDIVANSDVVTNGTINLTRV